MDNLFKEQSQKIKIYVGVETTTDPYEKTVSTAHLNPISIEAIVSDMTTTKMMYAMPGIVADKAKVITVKKKYKNLLEQSQKIKVKGDSDFYEGWRTNGKMQLKIEGDYLRIYIYNKKAN